MTQDNEDFGPSQETFVEQEEDNKSNLEEEKD